MSVFTKEDKLDKDVPIPLYFQLKEIIEEKITSGQLEPGDLLPSERELSDRYNISRPTIRQALQELVNEGLLYREKGKGTFVAKPKIKYGFIQRLTTFYEDMERKGYKLKTKIRKQEIREAPKRIAEKLNLKTDNKVIFLDRVRYIEEEPIVRVLNFVPYEKCPGLIDIDLEDKSLYKVMREEFGISYYRAEISLEPIIAEEYDAEILDIEEGAPIHLMEDITYDQNNEPMDYFESRFRGDKGKVKVELYNKDYQKK